MYWAWIAYWDDEEDEWAFPTNLNVEMRTFVDQIWTDWETAYFIPAEQMWKCQCEAADEWQVRFNQTSGYVPVDPGENPCNGQDGWTIMWWIIEPE